MQHFTKRIEVNNHNLSFDFNRITTPDTMLYCVSVADTEGKIRLFYMVERKGQWHLTHPINYPDWIVALEVKLSTVISENEHAYS